MRSITIYFSLIIFAIASCSQVADKSENTIDSIAESSKIKDTASVVTENIDTKLSQSLNPTTEVDVYDTAHYVANMRFELMKYNDFMGNANYTNIIFEVEGKEDIIMEEMNENIKLPEQNTMCVVSYNVKNGEPSVVGNGKARDYFYLEDIKPVPMMPAKVKEMTKKIEFFKSRVEKYTKLGNQKIEKTIGKENMGDYTYEKFEKIIVEHKRTSKFWITSDISGFYPLEKPKNLFSEFVGQDDEFVASRPDYRYYFEDGFIFNGVFAGGNMIHLKGFETLRNGLKTGLNTSQVEEILGLPLISDKNTLVYADAFYSECGGSVTIYPSIFLFFEDEQLTEIFVSWRVEQCF